MIDWSRPHLRNPIWLLATNFPAAHSTQRYCRRAWAEELFDQRVIE